LYIIRSPRLVVEQNEIASVVTLVESKVERPIAVYGSWLVSNDVQGTLVVRVKQHDIFSMVIDRVREAVLVIVRDTASCWIQCFCQGLDETQLNKYKGPRTEPK